MKDYIEKFAAQKKTDSILLKARNTLSSYSKATGAQICITDHNFMTIPEVHEDISNERNNCLYCLKHQFDLAAKENWDYSFHPCRELHIGNMKKAIQSGGSCSYMCELGFSFWTCPVYEKQNFAGSVIGSGFLCVDKREAAEKMEILGKGRENKNQIMKRLSVYPDADQEQIRALSEMMLVCTESVSEDYNGYYKTLRRRDRQRTELNAVLDKMKNSGFSGNSISTGNSYPLEKEKNMIEAVQCGDIEKSTELLRELLGYILYSYSDQFKIIQSKVLELAILLSRMENSRSSNHGSYTMASYQYICSIEEAENTDDLVDIINQMTQYLAGEAFSFRGIRHVSALKKADRYIQANFSRKLSLREIAEASGLSAPYFCTIFKEEMGENLSSYLNRLRVEKASQLLAETNLSLNEISYNCGFEDQSWFSKIFKNYTGMNPGKIRQKSKVS